MICSTSNDFNIINEVKKLMLFYPSNLVINVTVSHALCNYLDLRIALDDVSDSYWKILFSTYFNPLTPVVFPWFLHKLPFS